VINLGHFVLTQIRHFVASDHYLVYFKLRHFDGVQVSELFTILSNGALRRLIFCCLHESPFWSFAAFHSFYASAILADAISIIRRGNAHNGHLKSQS